MTTHVVEEEEIKDLSTCCVCLNSYDNNQHKPKHLDCHHTFCTFCIKALVRIPANQVQCPKCRRTSRVSQQNVEQLPTNHYALNIIRWKHLSLNQHIKGLYWCFKCGSAADENPPGNLQLSPSFESRDLYHHRGPVCAIEFSSDGSYLVAGVSGSRLLLWRRRQFLSGDKNIPQPTVFKTSHNYAVSCVAMSPDNARLLSGAIDEDRFSIHDTQTAELLYSSPASNRVAHLIGPFAVEGFKRIALQPGTNGYTFSSLCSDGSVRIYDFRSNPSVPVIETINNTGSYKSAIVFSPSNPMHLTFADFKGAHIIDIRRSNSIFRSFSKRGCHGVQYSKNGNRLLCWGRDSQLSVYKLSSGNQPPSAGRLEITALDFSNKLGGRDSCCFAGRNDELVISTSRGGDLYIWRCASSGQEQMVDRPLLIRRGHHGGQSIESIRYSSVNNLLASSDFKGVIGLWSHRSLLAAA